MLRGSRGDGASLYQLARWHENHCEKVGAFILWPCSPDVAAGYRALERSAAAGYTPAIYAWRQAQVWRPCSRAAGLDGRGRQCLRSARERTATHRSGVACRLHAESRGEVILLAGVPEMTTRRCPSPGYRVSVAIVASRERGR
jgi:hypothetical protein